MPYPSGGYPFNTFNGGSPAQNPYFGSISPNGLNLGLVNVNPLVSFQFAKNEYGEKTFKPLVNLHVTPNENIISKVGALFKAKKFGGFGGGANPSLNQHYHTHTHYDGSGNYHPHHYDSGPPSHFEGPPHYPPSGPHYPPSGPHFDGPSHYLSSGPHFEGPTHYSPSGPHFESAPHFSSPSYYPTGYASDYGLSSPGSYHDTSYHANVNNIESSLPAGSSNNFEPSLGYSGRSANTTIVAQSTNADNFASYKQNTLPQPVNVAQTNVQNTQKQGIQSVSFPSNRRKRNVNGDSDTEPNNEPIAPKSNRLEKVIFIGRSLLGRH